MNEFIHFPGSTGHIRPDIPDEGVQGYLAMANPLTACDPVAPPPYEPNVTTSKSWILLIKRGGCDFDKKVEPSFSCCENCASVDWSIDWLIHRLSIDWLIDWFIELSIDWLIGWFIELSIDWLIDWFIDCRLIDWSIDWLIHRTVDWLIDWLVLVCARLISLGVFVIPGILN